ncbi:MAG TPA: 50S ribosomal protein L2, partial [Candidatus Paceibacterota bacterium]
MKTYKPYTKSRRHMSTITFKGKVTTNEPHKALTKGGKRDVGRSGGRISMRHKGGGHKRLFRDIDFGYKKLVPAVVETVEYDPNRSGFIGLLLYRDGERRYALLPQSVKVGSTIEAGETVKPTPGNRMPLKAMPIGA